MSAEEFAPAAPAAIWAATDIDAGTKVTLMALWSWALLKDQRSMPDEVEVFAKRREGMTFRDCLLARLSEQTGCKPRTVLSHLRKANKAGYCETSGRMATLFWPPRREHVDVCSEHADVHSGHSRVDTSVIEPDISVSEKDTPVIAPDTSVPNQLTHPLDHPIHPLDHQAPERFRLCPPDAEQPDLRARIRTWWNGRFVPERRRSYERWRPKSKVGTPQLTKGRLRDIERLLAEHKPHGSVDEKIAVLDHVLQVLSAEIAAKRGGKVPWKGSTYDTMKNWGDYWLRSKHFDRMASAEIPASAPSEAERSASLYSANEPLDFSYATSSHMSRRREQDGNTAVGGE